MANVDRPGVCEQCGRPLPEQRGAGRVRRYCGATCRSRARRRPGMSAVPASGVNNYLTDSSRQRIVDNVPGEAGALEAISLAQAIAQGAEEGLRMTVRQARDAGHTWAEIGQRLGTSRQAAFHRFGRPADPRTGVPMEPVLPDAGDRAIRLFGDLVSCRWAAARATFGPEVAAKLDARQLAATWAQVIGMTGRYERRGAPSVYQAGDYTIADIPLYFEVGERTGRVSYDREGRVAGLFILPPGLV